MRFSRLSLERYGRFQDCELAFRTGSPDLHIVYGANEAGKTTSLAAVSDLLFGFPGRSPYNFLFDYSLLRVGAVLEDGGRTLACRRKKGSAGTLLDASDASMAEAALLAMLKGQTRETFGLSFSLDQEALRQGGRAMVEAKNDLGRTLFAAGSGLTGIADELRKLENEAEAIWGPTTKGSRTFTQALKQHTDATRSVRDEALKPKAWSDAKAASERTRAALAAVRGERDTVQADVRAAERMRRIAPLARRREEHMTSLAGFQGTTDLTRQREDAAERVIGEADDAVRGKAAVEQLRAEIAERKSKVAGDAAALEHADEIDALVGGAGAEDKAARDLAQLSSDHTSALALVERLRTEAGANAGVVLPRATAARLRTLAQTHGELGAAARQLVEGRADVAERRRRATARLEASSAQTSFEDLVDAVDAARSLGADVDARCDAARRKAEGAATALAAALDRLRPWSGDVGDLVRSPGVGAKEIEAARLAILELANESKRENDGGRRSADQADAIAFEIGQLATGAAISAEEVSDARQERQERWLPLRAHVLTGEPLASPTEAVAEFEASISQVDERTELRFALADGSSRLALLEQRKGAHQLEAEQARARADDARKRQAEALSAWHLRLSEAGLPTLDPVRFQTWQEDRHGVEAGNTMLAELTAEADAVAERRDAARSSLQSAMGTADVGGPLAPVLSAAERRRRDLEQASQESLLAQADLEQIGSDEAAGERRQSRLDADLADNATAWATAIAEAGLTLDVNTSAAMLDLLDELREATAAEATLNRRIAGIGRDAREHASRVDKVADAIGMPSAETPGRLRGLRDRLAAARTAAALLQSLDEEERGRAGQAAEADAKLTVAEDTLRPLLAETGAADRAGLAAAIERSRAMRSLTDEVASIENRIVDEGDGMTLADLLSASAAADPATIAGQISQLNARLDELNATVDGAATAHGDARQLFAGLDVEGTSAADAAADAEQAKSELEVLAEHYILKRAQAVTLKWAIERYRERNQDPLLLRAGELFSILTTGAYSTLRVDTDGPSPRLLGMRADGRTLVEVGGMSEGTTDQLFLALRLAALEQSVAAGVTLPFLADDLFVNFDDERAEAGFRVLAEVAKSTQVLFFTHHPHLVTIARSVVGAELHSECALV